MSPTTAVIRTRIASARGIINEHPNDTSDNDEAQKCEFAEAKDVGEAEAEADGEGMEEEVER